MTIMKVTIIEVVPAWNCMKPVPAGGVENK